MPQITSAQLDAFATFPQCADNQFLPADTLTALSERRLTLKEAHREREVAVRREYIRAFVYSPEVVLNRAFAINEPQIFRDVESDPDSVGDLVAEGRLTIQLLGDEADLRQVLESSTFDRSAAGVLAWEEFLRSYGDGSLRYLKLNSRETGGVIKRFPNMVRTLMRIDEMNDSDAEAIYRAVAREATREGFDAFREFLRQTGEPWVRGRKPTELYRSDVYKKFVLPDGADASAFAIDPDKPFALELKLIADLAYNNNVPATLLRQSFIPMDMPNPLCLPEELYGRRIGDSTLREDVASGVVDHMLGERVTYAAQQAFLVPEWADLTVADVCAIHTWPEWRLFDQSFRLIVDAESPDDFSDRLNRFSLALESFHGRLAREIESTSSGSLQRLRAGSRLLTFIIHPVLTLGGHAIGLPELSGIVAENASGATLEFGLDLGIRFFEGRHRDMHAREIEQFQIRAAGVRKNLSAQIIETAAHAREIERQAEQVQETSTHAPRQRSQAQVA
jgi:hypothetical protein